MFKFRTLWIAAASTVLVASLSPAARASVWDKRTIVDFNERVEVPGAVLEPGKYVMKLLDSPSSRNIVQFLNERENHVYSTTFAIPTYRSQSAEKTILTFYEAPAGQPELLKEWFYPGDTRGFEFTYPKGRTLEIADARHVNLPTTSSSGRFASEYTSPDPGPLSAPAAASAAPVNTAPAAPEPVEVAAASPEPQAPASSSQQPSGTLPESSSSSPAPEQTLPKTASLIPSLALFGALGIGAALGLRRFKRTVG